MRIATAEPTKGEGKESTCLSKNIVISGGHSALKARDEGGNSVENVVWVDVGDCVSGKALGSLKYCLIGKWKTKPEPFPAAKEVEA